MCTPVDTRATSLIFRTFRKVLFWGRLSQKTTANSLFPFITKKENLTFTRLTTFGSKILPFSFCFLFNIKKKRVLHSYIWGKYLQAYMYPKVKVKVKVQGEEEDDLYAFEQSSLESLKAFDWLSLHYSVSDESPVSVARVPRSYAPKSPSNPSFLVSKDSDKKKTVLEENRKNIRPSTAPRPRAVLSSPDNDGIIGVKTHTRAKPHSGLKTRPLVQNRHMQCKVFPKSSGAESLAPAKGYDHKESTEPKHNSHPRHHKKIAPSSVHS